MRTRSTILMTVGAVVSALALAQDEPDPPGRAARLSYLNGTVSFQPGSVEEWVPATLNRPLTTGDRLWTEAGGRAELNIGSAEIRLNGRTNFSFVNLDDRIAQIQVSLGSVSVRVRRLAEDETIEVDTPQAALALVRPGEYRIDVNEQGDTTIATVRGGAAEATTGGQTIELHAREQIRIIAAEGAQPAIDQRDAPPSDAFDNWCMERDRREDGSLSAKYVSRDTPGYADLDDHGVWSEDPQYGPVWAPAGMPPDWAPYRFGHWAWIAPWGWTWVDDAPWGYAPFHYGRWVFVRGAWAWAPGPAAVRPVYAPALVAWVGGPRFGVGLSTGGPSVGWFPLGFGEVWVPAYHASPAYFSRVNVSNTRITNINVTNVRYMNQNVPGAVTAVSHETMMSGRPVALAAVRVPPGAMSGAEVGHSAAMTPQRGAILGGRAAYSVTPPAAVINRRMNIRTDSPAPRAPLSRPQPAPAPQATPRPQIDRVPPRTIERTAPPARPVSTPHPEQKREQRQKPKEKEKEKKQQ